MVGDSGIRVFGYFTPLLTRNIPPTANLNPFKTKQVRISDNAPDLKNQKKTYGGAVIAGADDGSYPMPSGALASNSLMDVSAIPTTQKQLRKMRKESEVLQKILKAESLARATAAAEMAAARMAAIKASRSAGRQANTGVNIERLSLPHPSGESSRYFLFILFSFLLT